MKDDFKFFEHGSRWLRADFHLHTKADKEFAYLGEENDFVKAYVSKLIDQKIRVAVLTNHNKFDRNEYQAIRKKAQKEEIYVLPGVELSVNDGANGIHTLLVFNPEEWFENNVDYINQFLSQTFVGKANYENKNGRSNDNLLETIKKLNAFDRDYFVIMAHIEQHNGLYDAMEGGRIGELGASSLFKKAVLGFQKVRTKDYLSNLDSWLGGHVPALVEGSDPKNLDDIGKGEPCYIKIGAFNFEAVKYALMDNQYRLSTVFPVSSNGYIRDITIEGQKYKGKIAFNHAMNNLIGIRGSGKSSLLELIRFALDIELTQNENEDFTYKKGIVDALLGSGGKIISTLVDDQGKRFRSEKTLGDSVSKVYNEDDEFQAGLKPKAIVKKPIYFGQKDLSKIGDSLTTESLISKLVGDKLVDKRREIDQKNQEIVRLVGEIKNLDSRLKEKPKYEERCAALKLKIQVFKDKEIDKKLDKQIKFDKDTNFIERVKDFEVRLMVSFGEFIDDYKNEFEDFYRYISRANNDEVQQTITSLKSYELLFNSLQGVFAAMKEKHDELLAIDKQFNVRYEALKEEFSQIKREIKLPNIEADDYVKFTRSYDITKTQLSELGKMDKRKSEIKRQLFIQLEELRKLWHEEYGLIQKEIAQVNNGQSFVNSEGKELKTIEIKVGFRENKEAYISYLQDQFKGCHMRQANFEFIVDSFPDLISVYRELMLSENRIDTNLSDNQWHSFRHCFYENLAAFLTYRIPDKFEIIYRGRPLREHSLGQRASALIIFLLTLKNSDLIIIDQPEDDLDNQTIYKDVIKVLNQLKNSSQFIFATHNPNLPVLGDCEQLIVCNYESKEIRIELGSIDSKVIRQRIVEIMEGGEEAFNTRKKIYELWTH